MGILYVLGLDRNLDLADMRSFTLLSACTTPEKERVLSRLPVLCNRSIHVHLCTVQNRSQRRKKQCLVRLSTALMHQKTWQQLWTPLLLFPGPFCRYLGHINDRLRGHCRLGMVGVCIMSTATPCSVLRRAIGIPVSISGFAAGVQSAVLQTETLLSKIRATMRSTGSRDMLGPGCWWVTWSRVVVSCNQHLDPTAIAICNGQDRCLELPFGSFDN